MAEIVVTHQFKRVSAMLRGIANTKQIQKATAAAIKRTLVSIRTIGAKEFRAKKMLKLSSAEVKDRIQQYSNIGGDKPVSSQFGKVWITPYAESLRRFGAKERNSGTKSIFGKNLKTVSVNRYGATYLTDPSRSFLAGKGAAKVLFSRVAGNRLPIQKLHGPSVGQLMVEQGIVPAMVRRAREQYPKAYRTALDYYVSKSVSRARAK